MQLMSLEVENFGSYEKLNYDYSCLGLSLIHGATGSGKSTFQDAPIWILFGITAKNGNADEVRSWTNKDEPTKGKLRIMIGDSTIEITRIRGKSTQNDLFWEKDGGIISRGRDINETQKFLNELLGFDSYVYTASAYYNEFSPTGSFFTAKASDRRNLFENLADLKLPTQLTERTANAKKELKKDLTKISESYNKTIGRLEQLKSSKAAIERDVETWSKIQERNIKELQIKSENFQQDKQSKITDLKAEIERFNQTKIKKVECFVADIEATEKKLLNETVKCGECGQPNKTHSELKLNIHRLCNLLENLEKSQSPHLIEYEKVSNQENHFQDRIIEEQSKTNPFLPQKHTTFCDIAETTGEAELLRSRIQKLEVKDIALTQLNKLSASLRGQLLKNAIKSIEDSTNKYLETYFDSELRAQFIMDDKDNLEILLFKSGHTCVYRQLSKGQRSLLKLCFSVSVMKLASNIAGTHFNTLCFDEALDGMDTTLKVKAFNLFSELAQVHETILVIDHDHSLQNLFSKKYYVTLKGDVSTITEE